MFSIALLPLVGLLLSQSLISRNSTWVERGLRAFMGAGFGLIAGLLLALCFSFAVPTTVQEQANYELASLRTSESINGVFVLGSGSINEQTVYRVLVKNADGSVSPQSVPGTLDTRIIEDESLQGRGTMTVRFVVDDHSSFLSKWAMVESTPHRILYEIHVPKGSVLAEFSVQ